MDIDKILTPVMIRIANDPSMKTLLSGTINAVKGPRRPKSMMGACSFTIHVLTNPRDENSKAYNGAMIVNFYCPNYADGNANVELMGPVAARIIELFDDVPLTMDGYLNFNLAVQEPLGPLFDSAFPDEHFMSVRIGFSLIKKGSG